MRRLRSEILFNRALLWLVMAYLALMADASMAFWVADVMMAIYNFWKSAREWGDI